MIRTVFLLLVGLMMAGGLMGQGEGHGQLPFHLEKHVKILSSDSLEGRSLGTEGKEKAVKYIAAEFRSAGLEPYYKQDYTKDFPLRMGLVNLLGTNVAGLVRGSDPTLTDEYIVIGAHFDHLGYNIQDKQKVIFHGADDNASGVSAMIELARLLVSQKETLKRSVIFVAFDGEESGLLGSRSFTTHDSLVRDKKVVAMFSLDMVGMYRKSKGLYLQGLLGLVNIHKVASKIADNQNITIKGVSSETAAMTDTWHFGLNEIPAIHVYTGLNSPYHKPEDTYEKLDYEGMANITLFMQSLVIEMARAEKLTPSTSFKRSGKPMAMKFAGGLYMGAGNSFHIYPDNYFNPKGVLTFQAGLFFELHSGKYFALQPGVAWLFDGSRSEDGKFQRQSLIVPVNLHLNLVNQYGGILRLYLIGGGYYLHGFSGKIGKESLDFEKSWLKDEWGVGAGAGFDVYGWQVRYLYQRSLTDISRDLQQKVFPVRWNFSVGYKLFKLPR
jgi:hypothetical protein